VPGVAFSDVDKLSGVTLFEMSYTKWGAKVLCLLLTLPAAIVISRVCCFIRDTRCDFLKNK